MLSNSDAWYTRKMIFTIRLRVGFLRRTIRIKFFNKMTEKVHFSGWFRFLTAFYFFLIFNKLENFRVSCYYWKLLWLSKLLRLFFENRIPEFFFGKTNKVYNPRIGFLWDGIPHEKVTSGFTWFLSIFGGLVFFFSCQNLQMKLSFVSAAGESNKLFLSIHLWQFSGCTRSR